MIDSETLAKIIQQQSKEKAAAASGWTAELLLPLVDDTFTSPESWSSNV
jgi:hypothetical protein